MFFFYAHVEELSGPLLGEHGHSAPLGHGRSYSHHIGVFSRKVCEHLSEYVLVSVVGMIPRNPFSGFRIEPAGSMPCDRVFLRIPVSFAFNGFAVQDARSVNIFYLFQSEDDLFDVISVNRAEISEPQRLEQIPARTLDKP